MCMQTIGIAAPFPQAGVVSLHDHTVSEQEIESCAC